MNGFRSSVRSVVIAPVVLGAVLMLAGPASKEAKGQWVLNPGFGYGGMGFGGWPGGFCGPGFGYVGFGGFGGFGVSTVGFGGFGYGSGFGFGMYPGGFSVLNSPSVQSGLAYQSLATGRMAPYAFNANPFAMAPGFGYGGFGYGGGFGYPGSYLPGFGPFGFAGEAYYNPYFSSGLTPLAVQSAREELMFQRAEAAAEGLAPPAVAPASRIRVIADPDRPRD